MGSNVKQVLSLLSQNYPFIQFKDFSRFGTQGRKLARPFSSSRKLLANERKIKDDTTLGNTETDSDTEKEILETKEEEEMPTEELKQATQKQYIDTTGDFNKKVPTWWDKQILMYGSRYDSMEDIPPEVRLVLLNGTYDRVRVYFGLYSIASLITMMFTIVYIGNRDIRRRREFSQIFTDAIWMAAEEKYAGQKIERKIKPKS